tara:strand:- start:1766 stop:2038 length:273 start_codon:yes stop_codon:yes gene_type:complete
MGQVVFIGFSIVLNGTTVVALCICEIVGLTVTGVRLLINSSIPFLELVGVLFCVLFCVLFEKGLNKTEGVVAVKGLGEKILGVLFLDIRL